jgi:tetratricopeptide (TPR) repeat protein
MIEATLARGRRNLAARAGAVVGAVVLACTVVVTPAAAESDRDACHTFDAGNPAKKVAACTRVINGGRLRGHDLAVAYNDRAEGHRLAKEYDQALDDFGRSIKADPQLAYAYMNRAEVWRLKEDYDQVIADATQAIRIDPALNASWTIRGMAYQKIGANEKARGDFNHALAIPIKGNDGEWAQNVARAQLKALGEDNKNADNNKNDDGARDNKAGQGAGKR